MNENELEVIESSSALEATIRGEVDTQIRTAKAWPRDLVKVKRAMLAFATLDVETAQACFYTVPRGGKSITGPSVRLAEIAASCFGNVRAGTRIVSVNPSGDMPAVVVQAFCHDLENNVAVTMEKRRRITSKKNHDGSRKPVDEDDVNLAVNACSAIAFRDSVYKTVPGALVKPVYEAARKFAIGDATTLAARRELCIEAFAKMGVTVKQILTLVERPLVEAINLDDLGTLLGVYSSIREGQTTIDETFKVPQVATFEKSEAPEQPVETPKRGARAAKETPKPVEAPAVVVAEPAAATLEVVTPTPETVQIVPIQEQFASMIVNAGFTFDLFMQWGIDTGNIIGVEKNWTGFQDIPDGRAARYLNAKNGLLFGLKHFKA